MSIRLSRWTIIGGILSVCAFVCVAGGDTIGVSPIASAQSPDKEIKYPEVNDAIARFKERDFDGALKLLEDASKKHPELPPAQIILAQLFASANIPAGMRGALEQAVMKVPSDPEAYLILAEFALRENRVTEADMLLTKARALLDAFKGDAKRKENMTARVLNGLSQVAIARSEWPAAKKLLEEWLKLDPKNAGIMERLARVQFMMKEQPEAYETLKKAKAVDEKVLQPEAQMAQFYAAIADADPKNMESAKKFINMALKADPKDLRVRLVAGQFFLEANQFDQAKEQASAALQADPKSIDAQIFRGVVALFLKDYSGAELYFQNAVLQSPNNFAASNNLALALVEQNDEAKKRLALDYASKNAQLNQKSAEALSTYGWVLYKNGHIDEAEKALNASASGGNVSPDTAFYLARISADRDKKETAKNLLKAALASKRPFSQRDEAQALLEKLGK